MTKKYKKADYLFSKYNLVLASGSPRRVKILNAAGYGFRQIIPNIKEDNNANLAPEKLSTSLAVEKAKAVKEEISDSEVALASDTIVILDGKILGKPENKKEAAKMLTMLSGKKHTVCSAIALMIRPDFLVSGYEETDVFFKNAKPDEIQKYVDTGEPLDKAGAYGIQEKTVFLVDRVEGNIDTVIGLPMMLLDQLAGKMIKIIEDV